MVPIVARERGHPRIVAENLSAALRTVDPDSKMRASSMRLAGLEAETAELTEVIPSNSRQQPMQRLWHQAERAFGLAGRNHPPHGDTHQCEARLFHRTILSCIVSPTETVIAPVRPTTSQACHPYRVRASEESAGRIERCSGVN